MQLRFTSKIDKFSSLITVANKFWLNAREMIKLTYLSDGERNSRKNLNMTLPTTITSWLTAMQDHPPRREGLFKIK